MKPVNVVTPRLRRLANRAVLAAWRTIDTLGEITPGTRAAERFGAMGAGTCLGFPMATLLNPACIHLGKHTLVGRQVTLSVGYGEHHPGDSGTPPPSRGLVIGDRCVIGARSSITAHESIVVGDDVWFGQGVFVTDTSHGYQDPSRPIGEQFGRHQPVLIGAGSWIGHGAVILPGTRLGRNVVVAAGSVVRGIVEDHAIVAGSPARIVRRLEPDVGWVSGDGDVRPLVRESRSRFRPEIGLSRAKT